MTLFIDDWIGEPGGPVFRGAGSDFSFHRTFEPIEPKTYLVDGLLAEGEISCWYGEPGATKSALVTDLACHVAAGIPWMGRGAGYHYEAHKGPDGVDHPEGWTPYDVLYVALERGAQVQRRVEAFTDEHNLQKPLRLAIHQGPLDFVNDDSDRLTEIVHACELKSCGVEFPEDEDGFHVRLIIIDTLARTFGSGSDSGGEETAKIARHLERTLKFTGAHIMLLHHTPIGDSSRLRGHGNLLAAFDQTIRVQRLKAGSVATVEKDNDTPEDLKPKFAYSLKSRVVHVDKRTGRETTAPVVVPAEMDEVKASPKKADKAAKVGKKPKASKGEQPVLDALLRLGGPQSEEAWKAEYDANPVDGISAANHRTRFSRGKVDLAKKGIIKLDDDGLWGITE